LEAIKVESVEFIDTLKSINIDSTKLKTTEINAIDLESMDLDFGLESAEQVLVIGFFA
jgi:hypothetical protein